MMNKIIAKCIVKIAYAFAGFSANTTCIHKYYQEELDEQVNGLRKY